MEALHERLDPGSKVLAGQDFRHTTQKDSESVADFIRHLEHVFQIAYGNDKMGLQPALRRPAFGSPNVSGALTYRELCVSAKNEGQRQNELKKCQDYQKRSTLQPPVKRPATKPRAYQASRICCWSLLVILPVIVDRRKREFRPSTNQEQEGNHEASEDWPQF